MVKIDHLNQSKTEKCGFDNQTNPANNQTPSKSGLISIIGQLLPLAPFAFEQFTGQKVPAMTGTMAEMQMALIQIQTGLQTIVQNQQALSQRLIALETNAGNQLTTLTQQFQSLRLTHTQETKLSETQKKQIEFNPNKITNQEENY